MNEIKKRIRELKEELDRKSQEFAKNQQNIQQLQQLSNKLSLEVVGIRRTIQELENLMFKKEKKQQNLDSKNTDNQSDRLKKKI